MKHIPADSMEETIKQQEKNLCRWHHRVKRDCIDLRDFSPLTATNIRDYYAEQDWEDLRNNLIQPEAAAMMYFRLRKAPDKIFSHGKWATLQRLEQLLEECL